MGAEKSSKKRKEKKKINTPLLSTRLCGLAKPLSFDLLLLALSSFEPLAIYVSDFLCVHRHTVNQEGYKVALAWQKTKKKT